jgi:hypothetical protein
MPYNAGSNAEAFAELRGARCWRGGARACASAAGSARTACASPATKLVDLCRRVPCANVVLRSHAQHQDHRERRLLGRVTTAIRHNRGRHAATDQLQVLNSSEKSFISSALHGLKLAR